MSSASIDTIVTAIIGKDHTSEVLCIDKFLGDDAIRLLSSRLSGNKLKQRLILRGNCIGPTGAAAIAATLKESNNFSFVSLEWNQIECDGAAHLAEALTLNTNLTHLDLRNNNISDDGAFALGKALTSNDTLKTLDLRWNQIGDEGALSFKSAMLDRSPPVFVQMKGNPLSLSVHSEVDGWLKGIVDQDQLQKQADSSSATIAQTVSIAEVDLHSNNSVHNTFQAAVLQKETAVLRTQCSRLQASCADMQRQLDSSALRVLQLEQLVLRHEFRSDQLTDAHKESSLRLATALEEQKALTTSWDLERLELGAEMKRNMKEKESDIRILISEKSSLKDRLQKLEEEIERSSVQFEDAMEESQTDRQQSQEDLRVALAEIGTLTTQEKKNEAEILTLNGKLKRLIDRQKVLECQLEENKRKNEEDRKIQIKNQEAEMKNVTEDFSALSLANNSKIEFITKEWNLAVAKIALLESEIVKQKIDFESKYDKGLLVARENEKDKLNHIIEDLRQRVQVYITTRTEIERRCEEYLKEIKCLQFDHGKETASMQTHLQSIEAELSRQRDTNVSLRNSMAANETEQKLKLHELETAKLNLKLQEEKAEEYLVKYSRANLEKQHYRDKNDAMELQLSNAAEARATEFQLILQNVTRSMSNEFETLRINMRIKEGN